MSQIVVRIKFTFWDKFWASSFDVYWSNTRVNRIQNVNILLAEILNSSNNLSLYWDYSNHLAIGLWTIFFQDFEVYLIFM